MKPSSASRLRYCGQVTGGVVRLGPEGGSGLVDALEHADHGLLVELRRLRQVGGLAEVVEAEHVRPRLGGRPDDLGRADLGEAEVVQGGAEPGHGGRADLERRPQPRVPQAGRRVVQDRGQRGGDRRPVQVKGRRLRRAGQRRDHRPDDLRSARRLVARDHRPGDRDHGLLGQFRGRRDLLRGGEDHLGQAGTVPDDQERHRFQLPPAVQPAGDPHLRADVRRQVRGQYTRDHRNPVQRCRSLGVRARGKLAVPPHLHRLPMAGGLVRARSRGRAGGAWGRAAGRGGRSSPHSGGSSPQGREAAFAAPGGSLRLAVPCATRLRQRVVTRIPGRDNHQGG